MTRSQELVRALLSVQRALLEVLSPSLYGGCIDTSGEALVLTWYVATNMPEPEREDISVAGAEVIADLPDSLSIREHFIEVSDPSVPLKTVGTWVLLQRGFLTREPV